jgi:NADH dehydrogenase [ubiquinone] 1 alpha subcomplex assembly factor 7
MTPLARQLVARITQAGPLSLADFMAECLFNPEHGYYATRDPLGQTGDFTTAPEISQMFGELVGLALAQAWLDRGAPAPIRLVELGPGRGTLMADILRATRGVPGFHAAIDLHLIETSPVLRARQSQTVPHPLNHHHHLADVPAGPLYLVANEFFDALPIRQFVRDGSGWRERLVGVTDGNLAFGLSDPTNPASLAARLDDTRDGDIVEIAPAAAAIASEIGARIAHDDGVALIIDYGDWHSLGDTFQAVRDHAKVDPLHAPGGSDLTAHVDFAALADAAKPAVTTRLTPQGVFLERLGITKRAEKLARTLQDDALTSHIAAHRRLTHPGEMGTVFKTMAVHRSNTALPPGFQP